MAGLIMGLLAGGLSATETGAGPTIRIVSYNIRHARGMDGQVDVKRTGDVLARLGADLVALQEVDRGCRRSEKQDLPAVLARRLSMAMRFAKFIDFEGGEYGLAVLSKYPIRQSRSIVLPRGEAEPRWALEVVVQPEGSRTPVSFICLHLDWLDERVRTGQVEALQKALANTTRPVILAGDFNCRRTGKPLEMLRAGGWNVLEKTDPKETFPADKPEAEIDFVVIRGFDPAKTHSEVVAESTASDHRPVLATITLGP